MNIQATSNSELDYTNTIPSTNEVNQIEECLKDLVNQIATLNTSECRRNLSSSEIHSIVPKKTIDTSALINRILQDISKASFISLDIIGPLELFRLTRDKKFSKSLSEEERLSQDQHEKFVSKINDFNKKSEDLQRIALSEDPELSEAVTRFKTLSEEDWEKYKAIAHQHFVFKDSIETLSSLNGPLYDYPPEENEHARLEMINKQSKLNCIGLAAKTISSNGLLTKEEFDKLNIKIISAKERLNVYFGLTNQLQISNKALRMLPTYLTTLSRLI